MKSSTNLIIEKSKIIGESLDEMFEAQGSFFVKKLFLIQKASYLLTQLHRHLKESIHGELE